MFKQMLGRGNLFENEIRDGHSSAEDNRAGCAPIVRLLPVAAGDKQNGHAGEIDGSGDGDISPEVTLNEK